MRAVGEPVTVEWRGGVPCALRWRTRRYPIRAVLDTWRAAGRWWQGAPPRDYWLFEAAGLTAEVYRVRAQGGEVWMLSRVGD